MAVNINVPSQVRTFANLAAFPASGALKTIYIAEDTNKTYRWTGSVYVEVSASASGITIGTTAITSGTVGRVMFQGTGNVVQQSSSLSFDDTAKTFTLSGNQNALTQTIVSNTTSGINSRAEVVLTSDTGSALFGRFSTLTTAYKILNPRDAYIFNSNGDISFLTDNPSGRIKFAAGASSTAQMTLFSTGNLGVKTTTDAGFGLDVNGTARVQGALTATNGFNLYSTNTSHYLESTSASSTDGTLNFRRNGGANGIYRFNLAGLQINSNWSTGECQILGIAGGGFLTFFSNAVEAMRIPSATRNLLINTTTDAGFRLDVNGTARVTTSLATPIWAWSGTNVSQRIQTTQIGSVNNALINIENGQGGLNYSTGAVNSILAINNSLILQNQAFASCFTINPTYNFSANVTSGAIMRGIYYNPTLNNIGTAQHFAFHSTSGRIRFENLPTSATGLATGDIWNDAGTLKIV